MSKFFVISPEFPANFRKFFFISFLILACNQTYQEDFVVKVGDEYLTREELSKVIPLTSSPEDSTKLAINHINNWIRKQVVLNQAEINLSDLQKDVEIQLEEYKKDLIIYKYESQLLKQKLDTSISSIEIENYYAQNQELFRLKDYALRVAYVKTKSDTENIDEVASQLSRFNENDSVAIFQYCEDYANKCFINSQEWVYRLHLTAD